MARFEIRADDKCWQVIEHKVRGEKSKKPGEEHYEIEGYYGRLEHAASALIELAARYEMRTNGGDILAAIQAAEKRCLEAISAHVPERFVRERAQLEQEWCQLKSMQAAMNVKVPEPVETEFTQPRIIRAG